MVWLVEGRISGHSKACVATLVLEMDEGRSQALKILISSKGRVQELVRTPASVRAIRLAAGDEDQSVSVPALRFRRLTTAEYRLRQLWRTGRTLHKQPSHRSARAGLTLTSMLCDLDHAYDIACRFRANVYAEGYDGWYREFYSVTPTDRALMDRCVRKWKNAPNFHITLQVSPQTTQAEISATRESLRAQTYQQFGIELWGGASGDWPGLIYRPRRDNDWRLLLRAGTTLSEQALFCLADAAVKTPDAALIYVDHDVLGMDGRLCDPVFHPDWSPEMLRATNYIGEAFAWNGQYADRLPDLRADVRGTNFAHALSLALSETGAPMVHVPAPLWHLAERGERADEGDTTLAVSGHLRRMKMSADVEERGAGYCQVRYSVPTPRPLVSIVIPTRDGLSYLRRCITSLIEKTQYGPYEIVVVDNQSTDPDTLRYMRSLEQCESNLRVLSFDEPFNYSRINNFAAAQAKGELLCLLNNDTEVISPDWLCEMVGLLSSDSVGVVGAKLLYGNGTVQHAGDTVGPGGCADHLHNGIARDDPGYAGRARIAQDLSAVTAACLLTKKSIFEALNGLDEINLKVAFNDVDYCLRVRDSGFRVVWTPHALLYHHESVSRGKDESPAKERRFRGEVNYMRRRWAHLMHCDPFYNPNCNYLQPNFSPSATPSVWQPWRTRADKRPDRHSSRLNSDSRAVK
ncbi:glycosyltransferase family 2 protein [Caballeronia hypogeia]|nr:glycosyltransferase family 2 protein [Caballeronia hypogeia]